MKDRREDGGYGVPVVCVIFLALIAAYVGGYFGLSTVAQMTDPDFEYRYVRLYPFRWIAVSYRPLARIESAVTGEAYGTGIESNE